jgi:predicted 2-oxoglutarate/Fe(II)-dependent dioxygenase YbiX
MTITDDFDQNYYVLIKDVLDQEKCEQACDRLFKLVAENKTVKDDQCPQSDAVYGDAYFDEMLSQLTAAFSDISGKNLIPTYSYARVYRTGETLKIHQDRPACEISATILLGFCENNNWPIFFSKTSDPNAADIKKVTQDVGSAVLYKGNKIYHWREPFDGPAGSWQCQVFLHYVDADGPHKNEKFDRRPELGCSALTKTNAVAAKKSDSIYYWEYPSVLTADFCNSVIGAYAHKDLKDGQIGEVDGVNANINKNIRNVKNTVLPMHEGIGAHLIGSAFVANQQAWNFNITRCDQIEYLRYDRSGRYIPHIDTFLNDTDENTRKLTALAFLNDEFEGGKFFLQVAEQRLYPEQKKGTIIVFPSFLLHGVEDVSAGVRHAVVCWMLGPKFR